MIIDTFKNINNIEKKIYVSLKPNDFINLINLASGLYLPLNKFCNSDDVNKIINFRKLNKFKHWTLPILLSCKLKQKFNFKKFYKLKYKNKVVGLIKPDDYFKINKKKTCSKLFSSNSKKHPYIKFIYNLKNSFIGGDVYLLKKFLPKNKYSAFNQIKDKKKFNFFKKSVVFSTRNICHLGHQFIHKHVLKKNKKLTIAIIENDKNKFDPRMIVESYKTLKKNTNLYKNLKIIRIALPSFYAGPNEAYLQATCFNNLGFKSFIVGRDHAGYKNYFNKYDSQNIFNKLSDLKIKILKTKEPLLCQECLNIGFENSNFCKCKNFKNYLSINGRDIKKMLLKNDIKSIEKFLSQPILFFLKKNLKKIREFRA